MTHDPTQHQDDQQQLQSQQLSRMGTRPPVDVPGYEPRQFLGAGAYGEVWVAVDEKTGRKVAIKFYTNRTNVAWSSLDREVEKLVFLSADRYVVQLLDVGWDAEPPYYVMEYVDGGSLQQLLDREGAIGVGEAVEMFREIATGLLHAHGKGVLHCDLKPANILLDQDRKPRLADFGQARLSHEQAPALGTLFYMAPEQADLAAVPDARWDVYALGALLYCMLTGQTPFRSQSLLESIDQAPALPQRLEKYRQAIRQSPVPDLHRQRRQVDRDLAEIVDRCLAVEPAARFPNVQSVLTALRARDAAKDRRPLLLLGLLGPLLFLLVLGVFGSRAYRKSVGESDAMLRASVHESSRFAAKAVSENVARQIEQYFRWVEEQAEDPALQNAVLNLRADTRELRETLIQPNVDKTAAISQLVAHDGRSELDERMVQLMQLHQQRVASWFVTDDLGLHLAAAIRNQAVKDSTIGVDYSRRAYFHGAGEDMPEQRHHALPPLSETQLSPVFRSEASGTWKVAISTPIRHEGTPIGVIALTVELGQLGNERVLAGADDRFVVLVDGRKEHRGQILQHPLFHEVITDLQRLHPDQPAKLPDYRAYQVPLDDLPVPGEPATEVNLYKDPLAATPEGKKYARNWVAARQPVQLHAELLDRSRPAVSARRIGDTGLIVLVQEDYDKASAPVLKLGQVLLRDAAMAICMMISGAVFLWYLVTRAWHDPQQAFRRGDVGWGTASSLQSMDTVEIPQALRERQRQQNRGTPSGNEPS